MSHIHIHLPKGMAVTRTNDAGFDESKVKRDHGQFASKAGPGTETHHSMLKPGDSLHDKNGQKVDHVESVGKAMHAGERTIHTRAGYQHQTKGGHLPDGMHAKASSYSEKPDAQAGQHPDLAKNQAAAAAAFNSGKHANMISRVPNPNKGQGWKDPSNTKK